MADIRWTIVIDRGWGDVHVEGRRAGKIVERRLFQTGPDYVPSLDTCIAHARAYLAERGITEYTTTHDIEAVA